MKKYIYPTLYSIVIIMVGVLITSVLYYFNITSSKVNTIFLYIVSVAAIFIGSFKLAKEVKIKGILSGILYFVLYLLISIILSLVFFKTKITIKGLLYYIVLLIFSIFGAIIGKNSTEETTTTN